MIRSTICKICGGDKRVKETLWEKDLFSVILHGPDERVVASQERSLSPGCVIKPLEAVEPNQRIEKEVWCGSCGVRYHVDSI